MAERMASPIDEELAHRLPFPLAQLYRRTHNAKNALERHQAAFYLWEASLKLLASVAVVTYAEMGDQDPELLERLRSLARPSLGHWWEFVRRLIPVLAEHAPRRDAFRDVCDLVLGRARDDLPRAAGLDAELREVLDQSPGARATVRVSELFDRLVRYRNREFGHGAAGQRAEGFYARMGQALAAGVGELLRRLDVLCGHSLVYVSGVHRQLSGDWLVERYELAGEMPRRLASLDLPESEAARLPRPGRVVLLARGDAGGALPSLRSLHPLVLFEPDANEFYFLNARRGQRRNEYLSYASGAVVTREELGTEQRGFLASLLRVEVSEADVDRWAERSRAEEPSATEEPPEPPVRRIGEFELLSRIGRGGMGVVYRAWQPSLGRQVAMKCLRSGGDARLETRFAREIRSLGRVEHPNLVKIFTSGSDGDQWFYAMELVEGADLAAICDRVKGTSASALGETEWNRALSSACEIARRNEQVLSPPPEGSAPGPPGAAGEEPRAAPSAGPAGAGPRAPRPQASHIRQVVECIRQVAGAAHALHETGVVHRDIKPGNIMLTSDGSHAVLMDLGLAQLADDIEGRLTRTRQFVGTLRYASPEQVLAAEALDRRSDIYSLGATLWELLTLQPIFGAGADTPTPTLMKRIQFDEPDRPRKHNPTIPRDLESIVLKCLEKNPARRYPSAEDLSEDLARWLRGEPVTARPLTLPYVLGKYIRRYRLRIAAAGAILLACLAGAAYAFLRIENARRSAETSLFDMFTSAGIRAGEEGRFGEAVLWFGHASNLARHDPDRHLANRLRWCNWLREAPAPVRVLSGDGEPIADLTFHRDRPFLITRTEKGACAIWDLDGETRLDLTVGDQPVTQAVWSPEGARLAIGFRDGGVEIYDFPAGRFERGGRIAPLPQERQPRLPPAPGRITALSFGPDDRSLAIASDRLWIWDTRESRFTVEGLIHPAPIRHVAFTARGDRILTACDDGRGRVYTLPKDGTEPVPLFPLFAWAGAERRSSRLSLVLPAFLDGDRQIIAMTRIDEIGLFDSATGEALQTLPFSESLSGFVLHPDGRSFAVLGETSAEFREAATGRRIGDPWEIPTEPTAASFRPDGVSLAVAESQGFVRIIDSSPGRPGESAALHRSRATMIPLPAIPGLVRHSPDGRFIAAALAGGLVCLWDAASETPMPSPFSGHSGLALVAPSVDGARFFCFYPGAAPEDIRVHDIATEEPAGPVLKIGETITGGAFSPTEDVVAILTSLEANRHAYWSKRNRPEETEGAVHLRSWRDGTRILRLVIPAEPYQAAFSPDGKRIGIRCKGGRTFLADARTGEIMTLRERGDAPQPILGGVLFARDGKILVSWDREGPLWTWETSTGERRPGGVASDWSSRHAFISPDGELLGTVSRVEGTAHDTVVIQEIDGGRILARLRHPASISKAAFSDDSGLVLTVCDDGKARVWDWRDGRPVCPPIEHEREIIDASFIPSAGPLAVSASALGTIRIWEWRSGKSVVPDAMSFHPAYGFLDDADFVQVTRDGRFLLLGGADPVETAPLSTLVGEVGAPSDPRAEILIGEVVSAHTALEAGGVSRLTPEEWLPRWESARIRRPESFSYDASPASAIAWHRRQAEILERNSLWDAAAWHLERLGAEANESDRQRYLRLQAFVRSWRFSPAAREWIRTEPLDPLSAGEIGAIEKETLAAPLVRSSGPFIDFRSRYVSCARRAGYVARRMHTDQPMNVKLLTGSDDQLRVWLDGEPIFEYGVYRGAVPDEDETSLALAPGTHSLLVEVSNNLMGWGLYLRFEDAGGRKLRLTDEGRLEPLSELAGSGQPAPR